MNKYIKWGIGIVLAPFLIFILLTIALYLPPVQNWAVKTVASYASEKTGMHITVGHVRLVFPLDLGVDDILVTQKNDSLPQVTDTIADIHRLVADVKLLPLLDSEVQIDEFFIENAKMNTADFIHEARVKGRLGFLTLASHGIELGNEKLRLDMAEIRDADLDIALSDTVPKDTTKEKSHWMIDLDKLAVTNSRAVVHMPGDTLQVEAFLGKADAATGHFDLYEGIYDIGHFALREGKINYDNNYQPRTAGLDTNHIALSDIALTLDSLRFHSPDLSLTIAECTMKEKSGITLQSLAAKVRMDAKKVLVKGDMAMPHSTLRADIDMDLNSFDSKKPGIIDADLDATLGKEDLLLAMGNMPKDFRNRWPGKPLSVKFTGKGNLNHVDITSAYAELPSAFKATLSGYADNPTDMDRMKADLRLSATTQDLDFVKALLPRNAQKKIGLPALRANADMKIRGRIYDADFTIAEGRGNLRGKAHLDSRAMDYTASINANDIQVQHFVRGMGLGGFTGSANVSGHGTNPFSSSTKITAQAAVSNFKYDKWNLNNVSLNAVLQSGKAHATLVSHNNLLNGTLGFDGLLSSNPIEATLTAEVNNVDFYALKITDAPFNFSGCAHIDIASDLNEYYKVQGIVSDLTFRDTLNVYRPDDMTLDLLTRSDTTHVVAHCGDFDINADMSGGYKAIMGFSDRIINEISRQVENRIIDETALRKVLPKGQMSVRIGTENPLSRFIRRAGYGYAAIDANLTSSMQDGLNGYVSIDTLQSSGMQLDKIRLRLESDAERMSYVAQIENGPDNPQYCFSAEARGVLNLNGTTLSVSIDDKNKRRGLYLDMAAMMEDEGIRLNFINGKQILGYKDFAVNDNNYIFLSRDMRVSADVRMRAKDGTGIQIYTDDGNLEALQDVTFSLHEFELKELLSVLPYTPDISGVLDGDFHVIVTPEDLSVASNVEFRNLIYEGSRIGNISSEFVYIPQNDGSHHIDGLLFMDDKEIGTIVGTYNPQGAGNIDATISMTEFPLHIANGFIPDQIIGIEGNGEGNLTINGSLDKPVVDGEIFLQDASLISVPYGIKMRFDDDPVRISNSKLLFENFQMYANNEQPLVMYGNIDFSDLSHVAMNLRMKAENYLIIDAKETRRSEAYGKGYVNLYAIINGELDRLRVRGRMDVLSSSDIYYILRDSPINTDNRLKELVTFTDLNNEEAISVTKPTVDGLDVSFTVNVVEGAHVKCWLNTDHTNYLDIVGNGELKMGYKSGDITLNGRYTISEGEMKYSLPIIPLKTFRISDGSYIEFTGDMMNPRLNITAQESVKAPVNIDETSQMVLFNCGVVLSKTLKDMGLEFVIEAPENQTISDELRSKTLEERGKLAVTMLTTGMYLTEDNTSSFTMNSALSSFLQQEINNLAGSALRTLDISVGLENSTDANGHTHMDYAFKFAKRFWNNRLSISVGGKISTGPDVTGQNNTFFDNVELQYRTSATSNQYLQLFYKRAVYDYLEGYVGEYGAGYMWKRKLQNFRDIFQFGDADLSLPQGTIMRALETSRKDSTIQQPANDRK